MELYGLERLQSIGEKALFGFPGDVKFIGAVPLLKIVGTQAFGSLASTAVIDIHDLWSLEIIGKWAFYESDAHMQVVGAAPRLTEIRSDAFALGTHPDNHFNITCTAGEGFKLGEIVFGETFPVSDMASIELSLNVACTCDDWPCGYGCPDGFVGAECQFSDATTCNNQGNALPNGSCVCFNGFVGAACQGGTLLSPCSLLVRNGKEDCVAANDDSVVSDCYDLETCTTMSTVLIIAARNDVTQIAQAAFAKFGGTITITGKFASLTHIGFMAFSYSHIDEFTEMSKQSSIIFGPGSLPVLG